MILRPSIYSVQFSVINNNDVCIHVLFIQDKSEVELMKKRIVCEINYDVSIVFLC